ncbi:MAG TPA: hypothetical protein VHX38_31645 [Pseudonocardiaceae bacterium]|nr:hypothetical protein [Pseudonocardiaceae bacterium]
MPEHQSGRRAGVRQHSRTTGPGGALTAGAPWGPQILLSWAVLTLVGAVVLIVCWYSVSGDYTFDDQKTSLNLAILAVVPANLAGAALLITGRRAVGMRRTRLLCDMPQRTRRTSASTADRDLPVAIAVLIGGSGLTHYHRMGCQMALGRDWPEAPRHTHEQEGRRPCGVCRP